MDGVPEPCDSLLDQDNDTVADDLDLCEGHDDRLDADADGLPDGCDSLNDSDDDGVSDDDDRCPGGDDRLDTDADGTPDACDTTPSGATFNDEPNGSSPPVNETNQATSNEETTTTDSQSSGEITRQISAVALALYVLFRVLRPKRPKP